VAVLEKLDLLPLIFNQQVQVIGCDPSLKGGKLLAGSYHVSMRRGILKVDWQLGFFLDETERTSILELGDVG